MSTLPARFADLILCFACLFRQRTWRYAQELLIGAILAPGIRTVASVLRVLGCARERRFVNYHRVLSRAVWSPRAARHVLLSLLVRTFVPEGPIVLGIGDTLERRRGAQALLYTDEPLSAQQIVAYFVQRWRAEVTFEEARRHWGFETQRQWSDQAIARSTPVILALFSRVTLLAIRLARRDHLPLRSAAWYRKPLPTFSDALAAVRAHGWRAVSLSTSDRKADLVNVPRSVFRRLNEVACYAA